MTIADDAVTAAATLTAAASSANSTDRSTAQSLARELTALAEQWDALQADISAGSATQLAAVERAVRAAEIVTSSDGGALSGAWYARANAAVDAARTHPGGASMADAVTSAITAFTGRRDRISRAQRDQTTISSQLTSLIASAGVLTTYLGAI